MAGVGRVRETTAQNDRHCISREVRDSWACVYAMAIPNMEEQDAFKGSRLPLPLRARSRVLDRRSPPSHFDSRRCRSSPPTAVSGPLGTLDRTACRSHTHAGPGPFRGGEPSRARWEACGGNERTAASCARREEAVVFGRLRRAYLGDGVGEGGSSRAGPQACCRLVRLRALQHE